MKNRKVINKYFLGENNSFYGKQHSKTTKEILRRKNLGERCPAYIDGRTSKQYYCECCGNSISAKNALYKRGICKECKDKLHSIVMKGHTNNPKGERSFNFKGGKPKCVDCGKEITYGKIRCRKCNGKEHSIRMLGENNPMFGKVTHGKGEKYKQIYMRSSYEIAYAKWLDKNSVNWIYEPKAFRLIIKGKEATYTPDFYLPDINKYIEIKGYWRDDAKEKFLEFKKQYPRVDLIVLNKEKLLEKAVL